jgi:hypothetical protein
MIVLLSGDDFARAVPWLPVVLCAFSILLFVLGVLLLRQGLQRALLFGLARRRRVRRGV